MTQVAMNAQTDYSELIALLETHKEDVIFLTRDGAPVVEMKLTRTLPPRKPGLGKNMIQLPDNFWELDQELDKEIEEMFEESLAKLDDVL